MSFTIPGVTVIPAEKMVEDKMRVLIHGYPGSGKTYYASTIAQFGKTLFVDMISEKGGRSYKGAEWYSNIDVVRPKSVVELTAIYKSLAKGDHPYEAVVLDSLSAVQKSAERWLLGYEEDSVTEIKKGRAGPDMRTWGNILNIVTDVCTFWMALADGNNKKPIHVVFTSQTKGHEDDEGNTRLYPDVSKGSRAVSLATPDYVLFTDWADVPDDVNGGMTLKHVVRIGPDLQVATKARIPANLHGKIPPVLGLGESPLSLFALAKTLGIK